MRSSATNRPTSKIALERMITTDMSANIVANLLKRGWTIPRVAETLDAPVDFVEGARAKKHVLALCDIKKLAKATGQTAQLMLLDSVEPHAGMEPLFDVTRRALEVSAAVRAGRPKTVTKKRRSRSRAA